jgi:tetratricopeptide (TPR) repeat protein
MAATIGATRAAALLAIRERELGTEDSGYLTRARKLAASASSDDTLGTLLDITDTLPTRGGTRRVNDDVELHRNQTAYRNRDAWNELLRAKADDDPLSAYLWLAFSCAYAPTGQQAVEEWLAQLPAWRDTPLVTYEAAICGGYDGPALDRLLQADARFVELNYFLALRAMLGGRIDEAIDRLQRAYGWRPRWPAVTTSLANAYLTLEDFDRAVDFFDRTLAVLPSSPDALLGKAQSLTYLGRYRDSLATLDRLLALERWLIGDARYWRALNEAQLEENEAAWEDVEQAAKLLVNAAVPKLAGTIAYRRQQLDVARAKFEESRERNPQDCETGFYLGVVLSDQRAWTRAAGMLVETATCLVNAERQLTQEIDQIRASNDPPARQARQIAKREQQIASGRRMRSTSWFNTAVAYYNLSRNDEAREYAERVATDDQFRERAQELLSRLR